MDPTTDDLQRSMQETRRDIEETRASMTEKLELLEERVRETVESATSTVEDIIDNVKGTVSQTVEVVKETVTDAQTTVEDIVENVKDTMDGTLTTVKQSFDLHYQTEQRPWLMFGGAVLVGYLAGGAFARKSGRGSYTGTRAGGSLGEDPMSSAWYNAAAVRTDSDNTESTPQYAPPQYAPPHRQGVWSGTLGQFKEEFDILKGALIGVVMHNVRELVKEQLPSVASQFERAIDGATRKLGAEPITEAESRPQPGNATPTQPRFRDPAVRAAG